MTTRTTRAPHRAPLRHRPYILKTAEVTAASRRGRQTILSPSKGYRISPNPPIEDVRLAT